MSSPVASIFLILKTVASKLNRCIFWQDAPHCRDTTHKQRHTCALDQSKHKQLHQDVLE